MKNIYSHFLNLLFPSTCVSCGEALDKNEECLCLKCLYLLPKTFLHLKKDNEIEKRFWGKVQIERATAFFYFQKGSPFQKLLHQLKYKGDKQIGEILGKQLGIDLLSSPDFCTVDIIVPVPLHPKKLRKRGYNQSECIAKGIAEKINKPMDTENLFRAIENPTQTTKSVYERWENVNGIFEIKDKTIFKNKHILLVDDVLTTGSTIVACVSAILQSENAKVSVVTLAVA
jgi:ComF family protein